MQISFISVCTRPGSTDGRSEMSVVSISIPCDGMFPIVTLSQGRAETKVRRYSRRRFVARHRSIDWPRLPTTESEEAVPKTITPLALMPLRGNGRLAGLAEFEREMRTMGLKRGSFNCIRYLRVSAEHRRWTWTPCLILLRRWSDMPPLMVVKVQEVKTKKERASEKSKQRRFHPRFIASGRVGPLHCHGIGIAQVAHVDSHSTRHAVFIWFLLGRYGYVATVWTEQRPRPFESIDKYHSTSLISH